MIPCLVVQSQRIGSLREQIGLERVAHARKNERVEVDLRDLAVLMAVQPVLDEFIRQIRFVVRVAFQQAKAD